MILHIKITGWLLILLACLHLIFPRYFNWKRELAGLSLINRQVMYIHTLFIGLMVFLMGLLCVGAPDDLINTMLGKKICLGLCTFWTTRLVVQFIGYSPKLWLGKGFETIIHITLTMVWLYISTVFALGGTGVYR